jgi:glycosyl hydrolase family 9/cellulase-like Ig domain-containing protein
MASTLRLTSLTLAIAVHAALAQTQPPRPLLPIEFEHSAESRWLKKRVEASKVLDDMTAASTWRMTGTATLTFPPEPRLGDMRVMRVDMRMFTGPPAPTSNRLSSVNLRRDFGSEDWRAYNRLSMWIRADISGFPMLPLQIVLHNDGAEKVPDRYGREGIHYVSVAKDGWQHITWEIEPLARDRVTSIEIGYWVNRMLAAPTDRVAFEIGRLELQRVEPDHHTGWDVAPGRIAFSNSGYRTGRSKTAIASDLTAPTFDVVRVSASALGEVVMRGPVTPTRTRLGSAQLLDFSAVNEPGTYVLRAGDVMTQPFRIGDDVWKASIWKTLNFFYGERCGFAVPGSHDVDHLDWFATHGDERIPMAGGWHDAGDLSQGVINTGEATYAMFALAERVRAVGDDPALEARLIEEAKWGLDWVLRVRFAGGYRMGFASHNLWTNNVPGDADDRTREAKNNPNANYIAAAAEAIAYRVLKDGEPALAERALRTAQEDWGYAVVGVDGPETWHTPAFAATRVELAGIGITASLELYRATNERKYADKAAELARVIVASQQTITVGSVFPLDGFFYTGPERDTLFHQFHRGNDQAAIVALGQLVELLPNHPDWIRWYATVVRYAEYQKRTAATTAPYGVLPAYVYRAADAVKEVPDSLALHLATREAYRAQVESGMPMGDGWYLRAFPVWFARRGNFGILLSQAKALSAASTLRGDSAGLELAQRQAEWIVGRNPFAASMMYGEGYDWSQQYSVSSGDFVGSLPVGMQSRGVTDLPYWPQQNMYVYKEVWVHPSARWLWLMADLLAERWSGESLGPGGKARTRDGSALAVAVAEGRSGEVVVRLTLGPGTTVGSVTLRADGLVVERPTRVVGAARGRAGGVRVVEWKARRVAPNVKWVAVVVPDGNLGRRREVVRDGVAPR